LMFFLPPEKPCALGDGAAAASMELVGISRPHQNPFSNEHWVERREPSMNPPDPLGGSFCHLSSFAPHHLVVVEAIRPIAFIELKISTMIFHASWKALFNSLTTENESGNQNTVGFTSAMDFKANLDIKMARLNQPYGFLPVANSTGEITILHTPPHNFGGVIGHGDIRNPKSADRNHRVSTIMVTE
jgi:hypothetical protein